MKNYFIILLLFPVLLFSCKREDTQSKLMAPKDQNSLSQSNNSVYQLQGNWTNQDGKQVSLSDLKRKVQIVAMIYTHCAVACPMIVEEMKSLRDALPVNERSKVNFVLVSFDSEKDTAQQLKNFAHQRNLDDHWTLLHGNEDQVRELSMVLNVKYKKLEDGNFTHSSIIFVFDKEGNIIQSHEGLGAATHEMIAGISQAMSSH